MKSIFKTVLPGSKGILVLLALVSVFMISSCTYSDVEGEGDSSGSSGSKTCYKECPYVGWGAFLTPSCWETVPCSTSAASLSCADAGGSGSMLTDVPTMYIGSEISEDDVGLILSGTFSITSVSLDYQFSQEEPLVMLTNLTTGVSWLAETGMVTAENGSESSSWESTVSVDGYSLIYGENRILASVGDTEGTYGSDEMVVSISY